MQTYLVVLHIVEFFVGFPSFVDVAVSLPLSLEHHLNYPAIVRYILNDYHTSR